MICPDKFTPLDKSMTGKISSLMMEKGTQISLSKLRELTSKHFVDVAQFILALDTLYALGKIEFDENSEIISYVE